MHGLTLNGAAMGVLLVALASSGCASVAADASIEFQGQGNGDHSEAASCGDAGELQGGGTLEDGSVTVRLTDGDGTELFERTFSESFELGQTNVTGDSGSWTLAAERSGDDLAGDPFNGDYEFHLNC